MSDETPVAQETPVQAPQKQIHGGRNLIILGIGATVIALLSTAVSLQIYRLTGDIYLDRSRPGYISEGEKHSTEDDQKENFSNEGEVTAKTVDEYLKELEKITTRLDEASDSFSSEALTDESLGISIEDADFEEDL